MKKLFLLPSLFFVISSFGYTSEDLLNAHFLADQQIIMKQTIASKYGLDNKILRQEAIGMALKVKGVTLPENYKCKKYFADATKNDWICRAVEIAADNGIISRGNKYANPGKNVTRAEAFIMLYNASGVVPLREVGGYDVLDKDAVSWQKDLINKIHDTNLSTPGEKNIYQDSPGMSGYFYPNRLATRVEVFGFVRSLLNNIDSPNMTGNSQYEIQYSANIHTNLTQNTEGNILKFGEPHNGLDGEKIYSYININPHTNTIDLLSNASKVLGTQMINGVQYVVVEYYDMFTVRNYLVFSDFYDFEFVNATIDDISMLKFRKDQHILSDKEVLKLYYYFLNQYSQEIKMEPYPGYLVNGLFKAFNMRTPAGVTQETFASWYKNPTAVTFREDTLKDLGDNTHEFLVDMTENGKKSTYKVKSKVNLEKFTIDNISSVKQ